jgi:hypothetical protein
LESAKSENNMAREGYIKARDDLNAAKQAWEMGEQWLAHLDVELGPDRRPMSPELRESLRKQRTEHRDKALACYRQAEEAFSPFRKPDPTRIKYLEHFRTILGVTREMGNRIRQEIDKGISLAELIRRALTMYFEAQDLKPVTASKVDGDEVF